MINGSARFHDRAQAGRALAQVLVQALAKAGLNDAVVLALPRGGVPVGFEIAQALGAPLDIVMVRKIGAPGHKEYGIGALVDGAAPHVVIDHEVARAVGASDNYIKTTIATELAEIERRRNAYRTGPPVSLANRTVIVVDDGIATGNTVRAALEALAAAGPRKLILAVPVAPRSSLAMLRPLCDEIICLIAPEPFYSVGAHYAVFDQTSDQEVISLLERARRNLEENSPAGAEGWP